MSSRERLVQLSSDETFKTRTSAKEEAVEKKTMKKKALPQSYPPPPPPLSVKDTGETATRKIRSTRRSLRSQTRTWISKRPAVEEPPPLRATKTTTTTTTTTVPKARRKLEKTAAAATATIMSKTTMTETENKWVEEIEPGVF